MKFQRARSEEQKQDRIQEILNASSIIYDTAGYEGLNFTAISEYTKFTRPNLYKYFKTKEEIILLILNQDLKSWIAKLSKSFVINKLYSIQEIGEIWTETLMEYERLIELHAILYTTIEKMSLWKHLLNSRKLQLKIMK